MIQFYDSATPNNQNAYTHQTFTCSKSNTETLEKGVKYNQS